MDDLSRGSTAPDERDAAGATGGSPSQSGTAEGRNAPAGSESGVGSTSPPGLRQGVGATKSAGIRLAKAHVSLAQAEFGEIFGEIKRLSVGVVIAIGLMFFVGILFPIGGTLFVGEWLFGSLGWGVLLGTLLSVAIALTAVLAVFGASQRQILGSMLIALVAGIAVGIIFGLDLPNQGWSRLGDNLFSGIEPGVRPLVTAVAGVAAFVAIVGLLAGLRVGGIRGAVGGLIGGAILGAMIGAVTAIRWGPQAGAGAGVATGLVVWPVALGLSVKRGGIDFNALKERLTPSQTIETTRETIEWVRKQMPLGRKS